MNKYKEYYKEIEKNKKLFDDCITEFQKIDNFNEKIDAAIPLLQFATCCNTGYWTCSCIEKFLTDYAKTIDIDNYDVKYEPNSFLHVMTTGYSTGGHTRVVERWIETAPKNQKHSVIMTTPQTYDMTALQERVEKKNGELILFDNSMSVNEKSLKLRKIGLSYQYIILHTHMDDITATIAFGTDKFKRPVLFYNHASHLFWIGKSIADIVLDIFKDDEITIKRRNISNTYFLGVPSKEINFVSKNKTKLREKLGLPVDKKIIITAGFDRKYCAIGDEHYGKIIEHIIDDNTCCYMIGMNYDNSDWKKYFKKHKKHLIPLGYINFDQGYLDYISSADLYIDSYPFPGGTAMIDAISQGVPAIFLETALGQFDYLKNSDSCCKTPELFIEKAKKILSDENYASELNKNMQTLLQNKVSIKAWEEKINNLLPLIPAEHRVKDLSTETDTNVIDDLAILDIILTDWNFFNKYSSIRKIQKESSNEILRNGLLDKKQGIPFIFQILTYKKGNKKIKLIKLLGIQIARWEKQK